MKNLDIEFRAVEDLQGSLRGNLAGVIIAVAEYQFLGEPAEKPGLFHGQSCSHGGHGVIEARLMQRYNIQIALAENDVGALGFLGQIQPVEYPAFGVYRRLRGVHILGLRLVQHPAAEGYHVPPCVDHREHEPVAEFIIQAAVLVLHHQTGVQQLRLGIPLFGHGGEQRVPCVQ